MSTGNGVFREPESDDIFGPSSAKRVLGEAAREMLQNSYEPRTLEDDPAFIRLLDKTNEQISILRKSAESASKDAVRARKIAIVSGIVGALGLVASIVSIILSFIL